MRQIAQDTKRCCGIAALPAPEGQTADRLCRLSANYPRTDTKVDLASLHPGGMTQYAETGVSLFLHDSSPEPVIGYGGAKGIFAYYQAVLHYGSLTE
ncbi:MAG: hypothetical protein WC586_10485 [Methanoregula sp.]